MRLVGLLFDRIISDKLIGLRHSMLKIYFVYDLCSSTKSHVTQMKIKSKKQSLFEVIFN